MMHSAGFTRGPAPDLTTDSESGLGARVYWANGPVWSPTPHPQHGCTGSGTKPKTRVVTEEKRNQEGAGRGESGQSENKLI
jgi:hypothetical protein